MKIVAYTREVAGDCRQIAALLGPTGELAGLFREGRTADISCPVEVGAGLTVKERSNGGIRFEKFTAFDAARVAEAAE